MFGRTPFARTDDRCDMHVFARAASLNTTGSYVPSGLGPATSLTSATLAAAAAQESAKSPIRPPTSSGLAGQVTAHSGASLPRIPWSLQRDRKYSCHDLMRSTARSARL